MAGSSPIESHDYVGPVLVACCVEVPHPSLGATLQTLLLGVGPDLHALTDVAGDGSCVARSARLRFLLPNSSQLHGLVAAPASDISASGRQVAAFGPYGLALCQVSLGDDLQQQLEVTSVTRLPDWPLDVAWLQENTSLLVAYGRNFLEQWRVSNRGALVQEARWPGPAEVSFLYSASLVCPDSANAASAFCAAGTFDGFVVLWQIAKASKPEAQLVGHQGAIFNIRFHLNGTTLVTASDDRTVKLWVRATESDTSGPWLCRATCRGHGCRVWDALLASDTIVTASEDSLVRVFSMEGTLLRELQGHQTRGVRCLELLHDFTWHGTAPKLAERLPPVVSGGEDGGVKLWPLVEVERKRSETKLWHVLEPNDWIREVLLLSQLLALVATNFGNIYRLPLAEAEGEEIVASLLFHADNAHFTSMAMGDDGMAIWTGCADGHGIFLRTADDTALPVAASTVEVFRQCRVSAAFGGHDGHGLFCDHAGRLRFFLADGVAATPVSRSQKQLTTPKGDKNQRLLSGLLLSSDPLWLLGDEHGRLHLVNLQDYQQNAAHEGKVLSLLRLRGGRGTTESLEFLSAGADGVVLRHHLEPGSTGSAGSAGSAGSGRDFRWTQLAVYRPGCGLRHLSHVQLQPAAEGDGMPPLFLGAFQSADFVLWDSLAGLEVWRHRCGGAKRPNSLVLDPVDGRSFTFAFSSSKSLEIHSTASTSTSSSTVPRALRRALHGREIHQICWLRAPGGAGAPGSLATASEDTSLRVLNVSGTTDTTDTKPCTALSPAAATVRFPGAVRALCSLPLHPTVPGTRGYATTEPMTLPRPGLLVSGGAKGALKAHLVSGDALLGVWCTSLGQVDPVKVEEADSTSDSEPGEADSDADGEAEPRASTAGRLEERVMALSCVELERSEAHHDVLLACASSSGFLRTWQLQIFPQQGKAEVTFLERFQVFNTTALCMECFTAPNFRGVYVGSAAGTLAALQLQNLKPLCEELQVHQAGVNDLALLQLDGSRVAALTAGDDHGLGLCIYALEDDAVRLIGSRLIESAHFSAVRSVAWTAADSALSLGLDRRLRLWRVELEEQALELKAERIASCTEPESMAAWVLPEGTLVALAGRGVELCLVASVPE